MLAKSDLDDISGLSCVENYLLAALRKELPGYEWLYYQSYLPFGALYSEMIGKQTPYAHFDAIPRIHQTAEKNGVIRFEWLTSPLAFTDPGYHCIRVKPEYFANRYGRGTWRDDHYFLIQPHDSTYLFLNDNPRDEGVIGTEELERAYAGEMIRFEVIRPITDRQKQAWRGFFSRRLTEDPDPAIDDEAITRDRIVQARDFIGILRVLRRRLDRFVNLFFPFDMRNYVSKLDSVYASLEYQRLKNRFDIGTFTETLGKLQQTDQKNIEIIQKRMAESDECELH